MIELKIKKKYFDAILELKKPFDLRHIEIPKGSIVKLVEIDNFIEHEVNDMQVVEITNIKPTGRYIIIESGECKKLEEKNNYYQCGYIRFMNNCGDTKMYWIDDYEYNQRHDWFDNFCWDYINEKQTYLIEIAKILEVK